MEQAKVPALFNDYADWQAPLHRLTRRVWRGAAMNGPAEPLASLDEIAAWVNEGGAGGEVRR